MGNANTPGQPVLPHELPHKSRFDPRYMHAGDELGQLPSLHEKLFFHAVKVTKYVGQRSNFIRIDCFVLDDPSIILALDDRGNTVMHAILAKDLTIDESMEFLPPEALGMPLASLYKGNGCDLSVELVRHLIQLGVDLGVQNDDGATALLKAVLNDSSDEIVDMLCREWTDPDLADKSGVSPASSVTKKRQGTLRKARKDFLEHGPSIRRRFGPIYVLQQLFGLNAPRQTARIQQILQAHHPFIARAQELMYGGRAFFESLPNDDTRYIYLDSLMTIVHATRRCHDNSHEYIRFLRPEGIDAPPKASLGILERPDP